ncbi:hypothetical protein ZWY2020_006410 [Hordeum vulgare]|nr:hypothetical protein ZWY2020_006410 [Hordeum vulgare]
MAPLVFSVPFPSAELLRVCSHEFIRCPINQFPISVHAAAAEPDSVPPFEKVWVLVYGLPRGGRSAPRGGKLTHILKAISEPVGKVVTADLASFEDDGPTRIEILCPAPSKIDGLSLIFFFGAKGRRLTFELESPVPEDRLRPAPAASVPRDEGHRGDGGSFGESSLCEEDAADVGVPPAPSDGRRSPSSTGGGSSGQAYPTSQVAPGVVAVVMAGPPHVATTAADLEIVEADVLSVGMGVCPSSSPCLLGMVCYSRLPGSPSFPALGSPEREPPPPLDLGMTAVTPAAAGPKARGGASPVVSARQSARLSQSRLLLDGRVPTIHDKATLRATACDLSPGNSTIPPAPSRFDSRFSILDCESVAHLAEVATDSGIVFRGEKGPIMEQISAICAKEKLEGAASLHATHGEPAPKP